MIPARAIHLNLAMKIAAVTMWTAVKPAIQYAASSEAGEERDGTEHCLITSAVQ